MLRQVALESQDMSRQNLAVACSCCLLVSSLSIPGEEMFALADTPQAETSWTQLVATEDLSGWRPVDDAAEHDWQSAGSVKLDANDQQRVVIQPGAGILTNAKQDGKTQNLLSETHFGDVEAHIEFFLPARSNSGVFFMALYELQVNDTFGKKEIEFSDCGGFYARPVDGKWVGGVAPRVNVCKPPGEWQSFHVVFRAPRFDPAGSKTQNARFLKVLHNGVLIHEDVEMEGPNSAHLDIPEAPEGPLMLQGDHGPVAYRNIRMRRLLLTEPTRTEAHDHVP